jgi:hypothetical protein
MCGYSKEASHHPGGIIHLEASSFSIRWRDLFPYPGMVDLMAGHGWTGLGGKKPPAPAEAEWMPPWWRFLARLFPPFLSISCVYRCSHFWFKLGAVKRNPAGALSNWCRTFFLCVVIWTRWTSLVDPSCRSTSDAMRSCPQQVVLPSLYLSMDGSSEEIKVAHAEYPFWSCRNSRCQKNVGRN